MKTIQELVDQLKEEGVEDERIRSEVTEVMRTAIRNRMELTGPPNPAIMAGVGQEHLGALFGYIISLIYAASTDEEIERVLYDFTEFRDFDITARQYQTFLLGGEG